jgi:MYXO-CTERM domain-containing protein
MTQKLVRWLPGCLLGLLSLGVPASAWATVVWTADFEAGDLSEWTPGINDEGNVEVLSEQVYAGSNAGKITLHPEDTFTFGQNRVDIQHQSDLTAEGADSWLSGYYYLPEDAKVRNEIGFYESNESYQNVMDFWIEPKQGGGTSLVFGVGFLGDTVLWTGDFTAGMWHQIAIHVHWSTDAAVGAVDFWLDGVQVVSDEKAKTKADGNTLFFQTGLHRIEVAQFTEIIYIDNFIEADSLAEAQIMAPMAGGGAGGAGGMAGSAGAGGAAMAGGGGAAGATVGGMGGASVAGAGGSPSSAGTMGAAAGAGGSGGSVAMSAAGSSTGPIGAPTAGSGTVMMPASDSSASGSSCATSTATTGGSLSLIGLLVAAMGVLRRRRARD